MFRPKNIVENLNPLAVIKSLEKADILAHASSALRLKPWLVSA